MVAMRFEKKEHLSREEAAQRLMAIAKALGDGEEFKLSRDGETLEFAVPDKVVLEFELEIDDEEVELEVELKWPTATKSSVSGRRHATADAAAS